MNLITIDFETYYDKEFSLTKMTTEEYVRDSRFEVIGVGVKVNNNDTEWASGTHEQLKQWLQKSFDWADSFVLAHNTLFDGAILSWCFNVNPRGWLDTLCMGRALHGVEVGGSLKALVERYGLGQKGTEVLNAIGKRRGDFSPEELSRYGDYCVNDVELTHKLFTKMVKNFPKKELQLIDLTLRMFTDPTLELDRDMLEDHLRTIQQSKEDLLQSANVDKEALMSNPKFAGLLKSFGVEAPMKISPTTGKPTLALAKNDEEFKALAEHEDVRVQTLVAARLGTKSTLEETRTQRFIDIAGRGTLPVPVRYYAAHTGRWGGDDKINMQNLPSRGQNANKLKKAIIAPKGYVIIDADSAQIEARVLAWLAGQEDLVEAFAQGKDVYKKMASAIYGKAEDEITKDQRFVGKTTILGAGYGMGALKFQAQLKTFGFAMELEEARRVIDIYRRTNNQITGLWRQAQNAVACMSRGDNAPLGRPGVLEVMPQECAIKLPSGLLMRYDDLKFKQTENGVEYDYKTRRGRTKIYGGKCLAGDTQVLTNRGWVPLVEVQITDQVWDGHEWVKHSGLTYQGKKSTIVLDGVRMTPDHKVLTEQGWTSASSCQGLHRSDFRMPNGGEVFGNERAAFYVEVQVPMWNSSAQNGDRCRKVRKAWWYAILRMYGWAKGKDPWNVNSSGVLGMAINARSVPFIFASGVAQLRSAWYSSVRKMEQVVCGFLERHGGYLQNWAYLRPYRQQRELFAGELSVGYAGSASTEYKICASSEHKKSKSTHRNTEIYITSSMAQEDVYDILNAGPRSQFMVRGSSGPFIVHNCVENVTQAIARCIIGEQMLKIAKKYRVVLTVHDAITCVVRESDKEEAQAFIEECMRWVPDWATGLPVNCESGMGQSYGDC